MKWFLKHLRPSKQWESVAQELDAQFRPGKFLGPDSLELEHRGYPIKVTLEYAGMDDGNPNQFTQIVATAPLGANARAVLLRSWPGQKIAELAVSAVGFRVEDPSLPDGVLIASSDASSAKQVFTTTAVEQAILSAPEGLKLLVGGRTLDWDRPCVDEVVVQSPGVVTTRKDLNSMIQVTRSLLDSLEENFLIRPRS
jgi:hypothetical protein